MARALDILALEPFYGGVRKCTLDLLQQNSRHSWHVYKLPARRMDRRLASASHWFSEQLSRVTPKPRFGAVYCSDAMNLADMVRLMPSLAGVPSVIYSYRNTLAGTEAADDTMKNACIASANAATELWFPSLHLMKSTLGDAAALADTYPEAGGRASLKRLVSKSQILYPPIEAAPPSREASVTDRARRQRGICLDNRLPRPEMYLPFLQQVSERKEPIALFILGGPLTSLPAGITGEVVTPRSDADMIGVFQQAEIFITAQPPSQFDRAPLLAMAAGCIPLMPRIGFYQEYLPEALHKWCLFDETSDELNSKVMDLWYLRRPAVSHTALAAIFERYSPSAATRLIDERFELLTADAEG
jgi:hypothetical protein